MRSQREMQAIIAAHTWFNSPRARLQRVATHSDREKVQRAMYMARRAKGYINGHVPPHINTCKGIPMPVDDFIGHLARD